MSFSQNTKDRINGWGTLLRFVTPVLLTIALWILGDMRNQIRDVRDNAKEFAGQVLTYETNHMEHHRVFEISMCERMTAIETEIKRLR